MSTKLTYWLIAMGVTCIMAIFDKSWKERFYRLGILGIFFYIIIDLQY